MAGAGTGLDHPAAALGTLDHGAVAGVDALGVVRPMLIGAPNIALDWWVGADDRWRVAADDGVVQSRAGAAPVIETALRVPGGDAVQRAYALGGERPLVVVDVENRSPAAFALAWVLRVERGAVAVTDRAVTVDGSPVLVLPRAPTRWAAAPSGASTRTMVMTGEAREGPLVATELAAAGELALLFPVPHRTVFRVALTPVGAGEVDLTRLADADSVRRGWARQLERALRTELPDAMQWCIDVARATVLIEGSAGGRPAPEVAAALEDWGFDDEARTVWAGLGLRDRRRARRRVPGSESWARARAVVDGVGTAVTVPGGAAQFLLAMRQVLAHETAGAVELLPHFPPDWLGQDLAVHAIPLRGGGEVSFALRWHGARPALLWDAPAGCTLRAPALDPTWSAPGGAGEALLAEPPVRLLPLGHATELPGERVEEPGSFS